MANRDRDDKPATRLSRILSAEVSQAGLYEVLSWMFWLLAVGSMSLEGWLLWRFGLGKAQTATLVFISLVAAIEVGAAIGMRAMARRAS